MLHHYRNQLLEDFKGLNSGPFTSMRLYVLVVEVLRAMVGENAEVQKANLNMQNFGTVEHSN